VALCGCGRPLSVDRGGGGGGPGKGTGETGTVAQRGLRVSHDRAWCGGRECGVDGQIAGWYKGNEGGE
jgi:hypothetical protein